MTIPVYLMTILYAWVTKVLLLLVHQCRSSVTQRSLLDASNCMYIILFVRIHAFVCVYFLLKDIMQLGHGFAVLLVS